MKKALSLLLAAAALLFAGCSSGGDAVAAGGTASTDEVYELKWAQTFGPSHIYTTELAERYIDLVRERSDGRIEITLYPGEQLGKVEDYLTMMNSGMVDIANIDTGVSLAEFPLHGVWQLPGAYDDAVVATHALLAMKIDGMLRAELDNMGVRNLVAVTVPPYILLNNRHPVYLPEDVQGMKFRVTGKSRILAMQGLGGVSVSMTSSDVIEALVRGTIDGTVNSANASVQYGYQEMVDYATTGIPIGGLDGGWVISQQTWDRLPPDLQQVMHDTGVEISHHVAGLLQEQLAHDLEGPIRENVVELVYVEGEAYDLWVEALSGVTQEWIEETNGKSLDAQGAIAERDALLEQYRVELGR